MPPKRKMKTWPLERKIDILRAYKVKRESTSREAFCNRYGVNINTLTDWLRRERLGEFGDIEQANAPVNAAVPPPTATPPPAPKVTKKSFTLPPQIKFDEDRLRHFRTACLVIQKWSRSNYDTSLVASEFSLSEDQVYQMINEVMRSAPTMFDLGFSPAPIVVKGCDCPERMKAIFDSAELK